MPISRLRAHLCHRPLPAQEDVGQRQGNERPHRILLQPHIAHLVKAPQPLEHTKDRLDAGTTLGPITVLSPLYRVNDATSAARALIGEIFGAGCLAGDQRLLAGIGRVAIDARCSLPSSSCGSGACRARWQR